MTQPDLTAQDLDHLASRGISADEAGRQLARLRSRPAPPAVVRPCTLGDGISRIEEHEQPGLIDLWRRAAGSGRILKFVPASGAATRMFADLFATEPTGEPTPAARELYAHRRDFAFAETLEDAVARRDDGGLEATVRALVEDQGLGLGSLPKALVPFHLYPSGPRTALVEQLVEAAGYVAADGSGIGVHFTVAEPHLDASRAHVERARIELEARFEAPLTIGFSLQDPASDTLAIDDEGRPFRTTDGKPLLRPSGHGALLGNLQELAAGEEGADIVVVKNIDNIQPEWRQSGVILWKRLLIGRLLQFETTLEELSQRLETSSSAAVEAARDLAALLGIEAEASDPVTWARQRLERPSRVCGMVRNTGEPGGGPFWVRADEGPPTPQIVEAAQIDLDDEVQQTAWRRATHFNPVDLVCSLRDRRGRAHDLRAFVDPATAFVSRKESDGRGLWALERPGLWNGAMAGWNTLFVEVPGSTFAPVKTVLDLLRPEHRSQPAR